MKTQKKPIPYPKLLKKAQDTFNTYIRKRDQDNCCISCNGPVQQAGHFYSAGHYSALRFSETNTHGQCIQCNYHKHGNLIPYRIRLEKKIGSQKLLLLDSASRHAVKKWSRTELEYIIEHYKALL